MQKYIILWVYTKYQSILPNENKGGYIENASDMFQAIEHFKSTHNMTTCVIVGIIEWSWSSSAFRHSWNMSD